MKEEATAVGGVPPQAGKSDFKKLWNNLLDYIWPQFCLGCEQEGSLLCQNCLANIQLLPADYQAWPENKNDFVFSHCHVCLDYHQALTQDLIKNFKYQYLKILQEPLTQILAKKIEQLNLNQDFVITNIPLHNKKRKKRGFDQTEVLAKNLSQKINVPYYALLTRCKNTKPQAQLERTERLNNLKQAFAAKEFDQNLVQNKTIILIDDVATTGTTLNEAAKALWILAPKEIIALVLAKN